MKSIPFLSDKKLLLRQALSAWVIYFLSVILFATVAVILSEFIQNKENVILISFLLISSIAIGFHLLLKKTNYFVMKQKKYVFPETEHDANSQFKFINRLRSELTKEPNSNSKQDHDLFIKIIREQIKFNKNLLITFLSMLFILFGISVFLVFNNLNSPQTIGYIFGGSFLGILAILDKLRRLWREKSVMDMTLILIKKLSPQKSLKIIDTLYWSLIRK
jgi:hypothetical protein